MDKEKLVSKLIHIAEQLITEKHGVIDLGIFLSSKKYIDYENGNPSQAAKELLDLLREFKVRAKNSFEKAGDLKKEMYESFSKELEYVLKLLALELKF